jgi:hypothetical protein
MQEEQIQEKTNKLVIIISNNQDKEIEEIINSYEQTQNKYNEFLIEIETKIQQLNHVKHVNDINSIFFCKNTEIERINPSNIELLKKTCLIDNCSKIVCYQLIFNKNIDKYICWHHLCNLIQNYSS